MRNVLNKEGLVVDEVPHVRLHLLEANVGPG